MAELPNPTAALQARFQAIHHGAMQGLPMLNAVLHVQALGFRHWPELPRVPFSFTPPS